MEVRKVVQVGGSIAITIPKSSGFELGDFVKVILKDGKITVEKIEE